LDLKKNIAVLGSTGSIGTQALEVVRKNPDRFVIEVLSAQNNSDHLIQQALEFKPNTVVIGNEKLYQKVKSELSSTDIKVFAGDDALSQIVEFDNIDLVLTAMVGFAGLKPTLNAIKYGKQIALANKETLVVAGDIITKLARDRGVNIYPVDSEHSAIFQCIAGEYNNAIEHIYLTASGGPFRRKSKKFLLTAKKESALKHPNWNMGDKITVDSASMMNKGLEVIEAKWLFNLKPSQIKVIVHPQSIIHSIVQFEDGSMKAQMGLPDMKLPIQYAIGYPSRIKSDFQRFDFMDYPKLTFEKPDTETFRNLKLAYNALEKAGNIPCALNAANEVAVAAFLKDRINFLQISEINEYCMENINYINNPSYDDYFETDTEARRLAEDFINNKLKINKIK